MPNKKIKMIIWKTQKSKNRHGWRICIVGIDRSFFSNAGKAIYYDELLEKSRNKMPDKKR